MPVTVLRNMPTRICLDLSALVCALLITITHGQAGSYYITLDVKTVTNTWTRINITESRNQMKFRTCVCERSSCKISVSQAATGNSESKYIIQSAKVDFARNRHQYSVCSLEPSSRLVYGTVSCSATKSKTIPCDINACSMKIVLVCNKESNVTIIWHASQEARVVEFDGVTLVNCCPDIQTTTRELTAAVTTSPATNLFSTHPSTSLIATSSMVFTPEAYMTQHVEDVSINTTSEYIRYGSANMDQQTSYASLQISGAHVGIIVGTAIAAILLTIIVMLVIRKLKSRRRNQAEDVNLPKRSQDFQDLGNAHTDDLRGRAYYKSDKPIQSVAHVSPLAPSPETGSQYTSGNYIYIDPIALRTTNEINTRADLSVPQPLCDNHLCTVTSEIIAVDSQSEYTQLGEKKIILGHPYNCLPPDNQDSTTSQYSRLGETNVPLENLYNYLPPDNSNVTSQSSEFGKVTTENANNNFHSNKTDPITSHPDYSHSSHGTNQNKTRHPGQQFCSKDTANHQPLPSFQCSTKGNTMEIGDTTRAMNTEIKRLPKKTDTKLDNQEADRKTVTQIPNSGVQSLEEIKPNIGCTEFAKSESDLEELYGNVKPTTQSHSNNTNTTQEELSQVNIRDSLMDMIYSNTNK